MSKVNYTVMDGKGSKECMYCGKVAIGRDYVPPKIVAEDPELLALCSEPPVSVPACALCKSVIYFKRFELSTVAMRKEYIARKIDRKKGRTADKESIKMRLTRAKPIEEDNEFTRRLRPGERRVEGGKPFVLDDIHLDEEERRGKAAWYVEPVTESKERSW